MTDEVTVPKKITLREACVLLGLHKSTVKRRIASGQYGKGVSSGLQSKPGAITRLYSYSDFGLEENAAVPPVDDVEDLDEDAPKEPELPYQDDPLDEVAPVIHHAPDEDQSFAARWGRNEIPDSAGNYRDGSNKLYTNPTTLLGPMEPKVEAKPDTNANYLRSREVMIGVDGEIVTDAGAANHPLNQGRGFAPPKPKPMADSRRKQSNDRRNIARAFSVRGV